MEERDVLLNLLVLLLLLGIVVIFGLPARMVGGGEVRREKGGEEEKTHFSIFFSSLGYSGFHSGFLRRKGSKGQ
jgi:hypothetical protein